MAQTKRNPRFPIKIKIRTKTKRCRMRMMVHMNMMNSQRSASRSTGCRRFGISQATSGIMRNPQHFLTLLLSILLVTQICTDSTWALLKTLLICSQLKKTSRHTNTNLRINGNLTFKLCSIIARLLMKNKVTFTFQRKNWESFSTTNLNTTG